MVKSIIVGALLLAASLVFPLAVFADSDDEIAGIVLSLDGNWQAKYKSDKRDLQRGSGIPNGWTLNRVSPTGSLRLVKADGQEIDCPKQHYACGCPITVAPNSNAIQNLFSAAMKLFAKEPDRWISTVSRSTQQPTDCVIKIAGAKTDLSSAFPYRAGETVSYRISDLDDHEVLSGTVKVQKRFLIDCKKITPGAYRVACKGASPGSDELTAVVGFADRDAYAKAYRQFGQAKEKLRGLETSAADRAVKQGLLRAYISNELTLPEKR